MSDLPPDQSMHGQYSPACLECSPLLAARVLPNICFPLLCTILLRSWLGIFGTILYVAHWVWMPFTLVEGLIFGALSDKLR